MTDVIIIVLVVGLAALAGFSIYMNGRPVDLSRPPMVPWLAVGMFSAACEIMAVAYAMAYFGG
jgi:hypothetical protein